MKILICVCTVSPSFTCWKENRFLKPGFVYFLPDFQIPFFLSDKVTHEATIKSQSINFTVTSCFLSRIL